MKSSVKNKELMDKVVELYHKKYTASQIGDTLGLNRNQVAGLLTHGRKLGYDLPLRQVRFMRPNPNKGQPLSELAKHKMKENKAKSNKIKEAQYKHLVKVDTFPYLVLEIYPEVTEIPPEGLPLLRIPANGCKFPIGQAEDNTHLFCAQPRAESSYCLKHMKIMWPNRYK